MVISFYFILFCACSVWVARKPPGFAFIDFDDKRDADDAIRDLDGNVVNMLNFASILCYVRHELHLGFLI